MNYKKNKSIDLIAISLSMAFFIINLSCEKENVRVSHIGYIDSLKAVSSLTLLELGETRVFDDTASYPATAMWLSIEELCDIARWETYLFDFDETSLPDSLKNGLIANLPLALTITCDSSKLNIHTNYYEHLSLKALPLGYRSIYFTCVFDFYSKKLVTYKLSYEQIHPDSLYDEGRKSREKKFIDLIDEKILSGSIYNEHFLRLYCKLKKSHKSRGCCKNDI